MATTSPEPSLPSSSLLSSDGVAVGLAAASGTRARGRDGVPVSITASSRITLMATAVSIAVELMPIARNGDNRDGASISVTVALETTVEVTTLEQVAMPVPSKISSAAKLSLRTYFEGVDWPLDKALPRGAEFLDGPLGTIAKQHSLRKLPVARQLLNYKRGMFLNMQISILLNLSDICERLYESIGCTSNFVSSTLERICNLDVSSCCFDFDNICIVMSSLPATARTYVQLLARSPDDTCF
jgi:hypothetical protein